MKYFLTSNLNINPIVTNIIIEYSDAKYRYFLKFIKNDHTYLEREPLEHVTKKKQLVAFKHKGFWQCMDTKRDKDNLEEILKKNYFK